MRLVLGDYMDFSCKMSLATKILLQTLVENTQFSSSGNGVGEVITNVSIVAMPRGLCWFGVCR